MMNISKDLRPSFGPIRDQGERPTCLPFATSDAHAAVREGREVLSPEYLFLHAQQRSLKNPDDGCSVAEILDILRENGQPEEHLCPYSLNSPVPTHPPTIPDASLFRRLGEAHQSGFPDILEGLDQNKPVILLLKLSTKFFSISGKVPLDFEPSSPPDPAIRHAVVAVAHGCVDDRDGILIRNSWGPTWADHGHAWLSEDFVQQAMLGYIILGRNPDGNGHSLAV